MTKLEALIELRDAVKADDDFDMLPAFPNLHHRNLFVSSYTGSLDAAKALHEAVLPGWAWTVGDNEAVVYGPNEWIGEQDHFVAVVSDSNPARAWLLTILGALIAQEE